MKLEGGAQRLPAQRHPEAGHARVLAQLRHPPHDAGDAGDGDDRDRNPGDPAVFGGPQLAIYTCDEQPYHRVATGIPTFDKRPG